MERSTKHLALTRFVDFMVDKKDQTKCVAIKIKGSGTILYEGDEEIESIIGPAFKNLQEACFYDFGKDMEGCD